MNAPPFPFRAAPDLLADSARVWLAGYRRRERVAPWMGETAWRMLLTLAVEDAASITSLALGAGAKETTGLRYLDMLARRGLIAIAPHPHDRRSRIVTLTDAGRALVETAA